MKRYVKSMDGKVKFSRDINFFKLVHKCNATPIKMSIAVS